MRDDGVASADYDRRVQKLDVSGGAEPATGTGVGLDTIAVEHLEGRGETGDEAVAVDGNAFERNRPCPVNVKAGLGRSNSIRRTSSAS